MAEKDITEKTFEALNDVFADLVNGLLFKGRPVVNENLLEDAQPFSMYKMDGGIHEQERDVSKYWVNQARFRVALFGFENQSKYEKRMALRIIGYDGTAYRAQLHNDVLYPVITLVLNFGDDKWGECKSLFDLIKVPDELAPFVNDYKINVFDIAHLPMEAIDYFHGDVKILIDFFVKRRINNDYRPKDPERFKHTDELLKLLTAITGDDRFVETLNWKGGKPETMCDVLDRVEEKGREEGTVNTRLDDIKNLMASTAWTAQQAMDALKIPLSEQEIYRPML